MQLKNAINELIEQPGAQRPERIKFFRGQMQTIISRALADQDIVPVPSRRCYTLHDWLAQRAQHVYPSHPRFSPLKAGTRLRSDWGPVAELPPALRGEAWSFVQLPMDVLLKARRVSGRGECTAFCVAGIVECTPMHGPRGTPPERAHP